MPAALKVRTGNVDAGGTKGYVGGTKFDQMASELKA
jgi:hypothetical protein